MTRESQRYRAYVGNEMIHQSRGLRARIKLFVREIYETPLKKFKFRQIEDGGTLDIAISATQKSCVIHRTLYISEYNWVYISTCQLEHT